MPDVSTSSAPLPAKASAGLIVALAVIMAALFSVDRFFARLEVREVHGEAHGLYENGQKLLHENRASEAVDKLSRAYALERNNREFALALGDAQRKAGQIDAAQTTIDELLDGDPNDGRANLVMARVMATRKDFKQADSYYHRAIYGTWPASAAHDRVNARLELAMMLANEGDKEQLLAELLPLEAEAKTHPELAQKIPDLYLQAGALGRAEEAYRALIRESPDDSAAYSGLARVEMLSGDFRSARATLAEALRHSPDDPMLTGQLRVAGEAIDLDPTPRRMASSEKYSRSVRILKLAANDLRDCATSQEIQQSVHPLLESADKAASGKRPNAFTNEMAEDRLALAEQIWQSRNKVCDQPENTGTLALLMKKLAQ